MGRLKTSILWTLSKEKCIELIENNDTISDILKSLNMCPNGGNSATLYKIFKEYNIDISKFKSTNKGRKFKNFKTLVSNNDLFIKNSKHSRKTAKLRILKEKLIPYVCEQCGQLPIWNGKELVLVLDHINGINNDHRLENLRFLCPNCNAQQDTFCGKHYRQKDISIDEKEILDKIFLKDIQEKIIRIKNYIVDFNKPNWIKEVAKLENTSCISIQRFMRKYMYDFYKSCYICKNQYK